jgi:NAD(P)-dependent dehydrogenase (short-subunit alcohol dehydrogenase family)
VPDADLLDPVGGSSAAWGDVLALNLGAAVEMTRAALPALSRARGAIVNIGSVSAHDPRGVPLSYAAAKAALSAFSRGLAEKARDTGVRVNVVTPGATRTAILTSPEGYLGKVSALMGIDQEAVLAAMPDQSGMVTGKLIEPAEIARAVLLLASPTMASAVGSNWTVDGGTLKTP